MPAQEIEDADNKQSHDGEQQKTPQQDAASSGSVSSNASPQLQAYQALCSQGMYRYESKRAGGVYERMLRVLSSGGGGGGGGTGSSSVANNCNNMASGIRDVQVHRSSTGRQHTRVETELQPTGATADLNINIIMDSDSNFSNALGGQASIEYESKDQTGPDSEEVSTAVAPGSPGSDPNASSQGGGGSVSPDSSAAARTLRTSEDAAGQVSTSGPDSRAGGSMGGAAASFSPPPSDSEQSAPVAAAAATAPQRHVSKPALPQSVPTAVSAPPPAAASEAPIATAVPAATASAADGASPTTSDSLLPQEQPPRPSPPPRQSPPPQLGGGRRRQGRSSRTDSIDGRRRLGRGSRSDSVDGMRSTGDLATTLLHRASDESGDSDDDDDDDEEEEEGEGEGEEGDMDEAQRHFQRYLDGEKVDVLRGPAKDDEGRETRRRLSVGYLEKEGTVIGCMSVFADVHIKEFIVFLSDEMIQAFLVDPGRFRSVANRTKCEIEVTRRILNRRMGRYRWLKYLVVDIRGPSYSAIDQCDKMMTLLFPPYKGRKPYGAPAVVSLFLKENAPDNTDLYFNFQRTGPSKNMFGEIPLRAPFRKTRNRPVETTPWKAVQKRQQWGILEPKNDRMETVMSHVYPERGGTFTAALDHSIKWAEAAEEAVVMAKAKDMARAQMLKSRKLDSEPLFANVFGD